MSPSNPKPSRLRAFAKRFRQSNFGSVTTEIALAAPVFITLLAGVIETGNFLLLNLKLQHTAVSLADLVTRDSDITEAVINDIFTAVPTIMTPYSVDSEAVYFVSAVSKAEDEPQSVYWQRSSGALIEREALVGVVGEAPNLPDMIPVRDDETILVAEIHYRYEPLMFQMIEPQVIVKTAYFRPRLGALQEVDP